MTADNSDAPAKPNEKLVEETIDKIDGKHHGGKGELRVSPSVSTSGSESGRARRCVVGDAGRVREASCRRH